MDKHYCKAVFVGTKDVAGQQVYTFKITNEVVDRQREVVAADGFDFRDYMANPVVIDSHDYSSIENILGRTVDIRRNGDAHEADILFNDTPKGQLAKALVDSGDLRATSIGFISGELELGKGRDDPAIHKQSTLLEISMVCVPANQEALRLRDLQTREAHPPHTTPKADEGMAWDGPAQVREAEGEAQLWGMHAWRDSEGDPEVKSSYKLPHHLASGEVVWRGVAAAMTALLGGRGGVAIPDGDRRGTWQHLARHYSQFDKEPPEFKSLEELEAFGADEIKGLFYEGEMDMDVTEKRGRVLSAKNETALKQAADLIASVLASLGQQDDGDDEGDKDGKTIEADLGVLLKFAGKDN